MPPSSRSRSAALRWSGLPQWGAQQAAWWACVLWMGWAGPAAMLAFVVLHLVVLRRQWKAELALVCGATVVGAALDNGLALWVAYEGTLRVGHARCGSWPCSLGLGHLRHSQAALMRSVPVALLAGAVGGPLAAEAARPSRGSTCWARPVGSRCRWWAVPWCCCSGRAGGVAALSG